MNLFMRAAAFLLVTTLGQVPPPKYALTFEVTEPQGALYLGESELGTGYVQLVITTGQGVGKVTHFVGYWRTASGG